MESDIFIRYAKLWKQMIDKNINKTELKDGAGISTNAVAKMGKNTRFYGNAWQNFRALQCEVGDIVDITKNRK